MLNLRVVLISLISVLLFLLLAKNYCKEKEHFFRPIRRIIGTNQYGILENSAINKQPIDQCLNSCTNFYYTNKYANPHKAQKLDYSCRQLCLCDAYRVANCAKYNSKIKNMNNATSEQNKNLNNFHQCLRGALPNKEKIIVYRDLCSKYLNEKDCNSNYPDNSGTTYKCKWHTPTRGPNKGKPLCTYTKAGGCADDPYGMAVPM